jgi:hypothetical protein
MDHPLLTCLIGNCPWECAPNGRLRPEILCIANWLAGKERFDLAYIPAPVASRRRARMSGGLVECCLEYPSFT